MKPSYSLAVLLLSSCLYSSALAEEVVRCPGAYRGHLQGICTDPQGNIYWSFTEDLVKTTKTGELVKAISVASHHGDLCHVDGKLYVAVNLGKFNQPAGVADSWVYIYDAESLAELSRHQVPEVVHGAGGLAYHDGRFLVVGGLPLETPQNYLYEYDAEFKFVGRHELESGFTLMGIQTATYADGQWWFGCYGNPRLVLTADAEFKFLARQEFDASLGITPLEAGTFLIGRNHLERGQGYVAEAYVVTVDEDGHLQAK